MRSRDDGIQSTGSSPAHGPMTGDSDELSSMPNDLAELLGIVEWEPCGDVDVRGDWAIVGSVIADDGGEGIEVVPRQGLGSAAQYTLYAAAAAVCCFGIKALEGWRYRAELGVYVVGVEMRLPVDRLVRCAAIAATRSSDSSVPRTTSGSSVPSGR